MSNIIGDEGGSFSSGNNTGVGEVKFDYLNSIASTTTTTTTTITAAAASTTNSNGSTTQQLQPPPLKKKRNLPGNPDPSAEVIALSPKTLMATNRFVCEICNKGFQRDQNLQLHRRGHNLPWKLRQRTSNEIRKRVYVCPEPSCVHHNPARALGDLTGIKKHFCRKHGEKKWKCDKCSKKYAVQSDWKAHAKTCGTKEYKCDCGSIFSRRDSFITHRAFCDALTEENSKANQGLLPNNMEPNLQGQAANLISIPIDNNNNNQDQSTITSSFNYLDTKIPLSLPHELKPMPPKLPSPTMFSSTSCTTLLGGGGARTTTMSNSSSSLQLSANSSSIFEGNGRVPGLASMSATALLQKAAQMGATINNLNSMAHSTFAPMQTLNDQFFNVGVQNSSVNDLGMFNGVLDQNNALFKNFEQEPSNNKSFFHGANSNPGADNLSGLSRFSEDVMTVDFLGIGGSRQRNNIREQQNQEMEFGGIDHSKFQGLGHFEQQTAAVEKPIWDV